MIDIYYANGIPKEYLIVRPQSQVPVEGQAGQSYSAVTVVGNQTNPFDGSNLQVISSNLAGAVTYAINALGYANLIGRRMVVVLNNTGAGNFGFDVTLPAGKHFVSSGLPGTATSLTTPNGATSQWVLDMTVNETNVVLVGVYTGWAFA